MQHPHSCFAPGSCVAAAPVSLLHCCVCWCAGVQVPVALVQEVLQARESATDLQAKYDAFAMRSFVEDNRALVWCTGV